MARPTHRLERRADLLSTKIQQRVNAVTNAITPRGEHPPFTETKTREEALAFWQEQRYTDLGKAIIAQWPPERVADLDAALAVWNTERLGGSPITLDTGLMDVAPVRDRGSPESWMS